MNKLVGKGAGGCPAEQLFTVGAVRLSNVGIQQAEIIMDLGKGGNRLARAG